MKVIYTSTKKLEPRSGNKYSTVYYKMSNEEYSKLTNHVIQVATEVADCLTESEFVSKELKGFGRTEGKPNYSIEQILADMIQQLSEGKDVTESMTNRWNRVFHQTEYEIIMEAI